jgi:hypothetical protein
MHKSVIILSLLFLMGILIIILVPFTSINFSNTMAQGYSDDGYSIYPTDDKKYECRTGPFEGFFVSSVEFCKHIKFDNKDRKDISRDDNKTGPQGPTGLQGPAGPQGPAGQSIIGPQGPPGISFLNSTNVYLNQSDLVTTGDNPTAVAEARQSCDDGDILLNGGYSILNTENLFDVTADRGFVTDSELPVGYLVQVRGESISFFGFAWCFDNPPLRP